MRRRCDGTDPNLLATDGSACACGQTFDDVEWMVTFPHARVGGGLPPGFRVPISPETRAVGNSIGDAIAKALPPGWGFGVFLFTFGEGGDMFWLSNAQRSDMVKALREWMRAEGS